MQTSRANPLDVLFTNIVGGLKALFHPGSCQKFIEWLKNLDQSVNSLKHEGEFILHAIVKRPYKCQKDAEHKQEYLLALLVHSDVDVNLYNEQKNTALHIAVEIGDEKSVETLLVFGANINALDGNNKTPLDLVKGPYRFLTRQESGFTLIDIDDFDMTAPEAIAPRKLPLLRSQASITDDEVPPVTPCLRYSRSALTAFTSMFGKTGDVGGMAELLSKYGGERGAMVVATAKCEQNLRTIKQFQDMITEELKEKSHTPCKIESCPVKDDWTTKIATLNYEISSNIERTLLDVHYPLSRNPDEAMAVGIQTKELKMLRDAGSRVLFLDGGGMRAVMQIEILSQLEEQTGRRITELFDWIVGTSTGGIIALALVYGKKSLREIRQLYFRLKDEVFGSGRLGMGYNTKKLEETLKDEFGDIKMSDIQYPRVIMTAVNKSTINLKLTFFNNCFGDEYSTEYVWRVARYGTGGPIFFSALDDYVDGGILANNPCGSGLTKIQDYYRSKKQKLPISVVVSVGSGKLPEDELGNVDAHEFLYLGKHWFNFKEHLSGRTKNLTTLLGNAVGESESIAQNVASRCKEQGVEYYRFSPQLTKVIPAGETDVNNLYEIALLAKKSISVSQGTKESLDFRRLIWRFQCCSHANKKMRVRLLQKAVSGP